MNRFVRAAAAAALAVGGAGSVGCVSSKHATGCGPGGCGDGGGQGHGDCAVLRTYIDPCWPERYNAAARGEVLAPFAAQVNNGQVLNQTVWNWYFVPGTDTLNTAGLAKLDSIAHTRPHPDPKLYVQVARDLPVTPDNMDKIGGLRDDLTARRAAAVQRYMAVQPAVDATAYEIFVHDPAVPGISADFGANAYRGQGQGYRGGIGGAGGAIATSTGGGGPAPAASAIGTGPTGGPAGPSGPPSPAPGTVPSGPGAPGGPGGPAVP